MAQNQAEMVRSSLLSCQCCVPQDWTDDQAASFVNGINPSGLECGWRMRHAGSPLLAGAPERQPCDIRAGFVHIMFDC
jgi:hypothetical protein